MQKALLLQAPSMTFVMFVGNIDGQIGLWLGASIISCVKILIVLAPLFIFKCKRRFMGEKTEKKDAQTSAGASSTNP